MDEGETNPKRIADERIDILISLATKVVRDNPARARRYVALAKKIGMRHSVRMGKRKNGFCGRCLIPFVCGLTCSTRVAKNGKLALKCLSCGHSRTVPIGRKEGRQKD